MEYAFVMAPKPCDHLLFAKPTACLLAFGTSAWLLCGSQGCHPEPRYPEPKDTAMCPKACDHLRALGCEEGKPYYDSDKPGPKGVPNASCEEFCQHQQDNHIALNPTCLAVVPSCDQIEAWRTKDCQGVAPTASASARSAR